MTAPRKIVQVTVPGRPAMNEPPATPEEQLRAYHELVIAGLRFGGTSDPRVERSVVRVIRGSLPSAREPSMA